MGAVTAEAAGEALEFDVALAPPTAVVVSEGAAGFGSSAVEAFAASAATEATMSKSAAANRW